MKLAIVSTSDIHAYLYPTDFTQKEMNLPLGLLKVSSFLKNISADEKLYIDNGDFIQGSPLASFVKDKVKTPRILSEFLNELHPVARVLGNHEFNYGVDYLKEAVEASTAPYLAANVLNTDGEPYFGTPYLVKEVGQFKVGIIGLTTQYTPHWENPENIKDFRFISAVEALRHWLPIVQASADFVVVSYHGGFEADPKTEKMLEKPTGENEGYQLLEQFEAIDVLFTGHQHGLYVGQHGKTFYSQPGHKGEYVAVVTLQIDEPTRTITDATIDLHHLTDVTEDLNLKAKVRPLEEQVEKWLDQPIGTVKTDMSITDPNKARLETHPYVTFINAVQSWATGCDISATALFNQKAPGFKGDITMRDIVINYIYTNTLAVLSVSGKDLVEALEQCAAFFTLSDGQITINPNYYIPKPQYYNYDIFSGIDYTFDISKPEGQRVVGLRYKGTPIDLKAPYEIVLNQYRAVGGGNFAMFGPEKIIREYGTDMTELIAQYIKEHPEVEVPAVHNFKVVY